MRGSRTKSGGPILSNDDVDEDMPERIRDRSSRSIRNRRQTEPSHTANVKEEYDPEWDHILGFSAEALSKLLSPGRTFNKRKFELGVDQLVFLGAPRFVRDDGFWKKMRKPRRRDRAESKVDIGDLVRPDESISGATSVAHTPIDESSDADASLKNVPIYDAAYGHGLMSGAASEVGSDPKSTSSTSGLDKSLGMFNVVFVMNPPAIEHQVRIEEMYDNIVKRFAKALKYAQALSNYVYLESRAISAMKEKAKEQETPMSTLWASIATHSSLARAIEITFRQISHDKIAHVNLGQDFDTSFQIPRAVSTRLVPYPTEPQMPGLWLTTASPLDEDDDSETSLSQHAALLLLEDVDVLLKEVESDAKELSGPLSYFIHNLKPTKSLKKIAQMSSLTVKDVELLSRHLIYWRRARAIPPLRHSYTYIVSPNADMRNLKKASAQYAARFQTMPSLYKMLQMLSLPRSYHNWIPSRNHRDVYMDILAWLMRYGWITQLRTFAWIVVRPEIKAAVAEKMENEKRQRSSTRENGSTNSGTSSRTVSTERPTTAHLVSPVEPPTYSKSIITSPLRASDLESRWIEEIGETLKDDEELSGIWPLLIQYFDGKRALEDVSVREGLKKKTLQPMWSRLIAKEIILTVRHW